MKNIKGIEFDCETDGFTIAIPHEAAGKLKGKVKVIVVQEEEYIVLQETKKEIFLGRDEIYERD